MRWGSGRVSYQECLIVEKVDKKCVCQSADCGTLRSITNMENVKKLGDLHNVTIIRQKIVKIYNLIISTSGIWLRKSAISRVFERLNS